MPRGKPDGLPPCDTTAEEAVIAAVFLDPSTLDKCISGHLQPEDFYRSQNGEVLGACFEAWEDSLEPTIIVVSGILERHGYKSPVEGSWGDYLTEIVSRHFTAVGVEAHITIVRNTARLRKTIEAAGEIAKLASTSSNPVDVLQTGIGLLGKQLTARDSGLEPPILGNLDPPKGPDWKIPVLDRYTFGQVPGHFTLVAGPSGEGKSMFCSQIVKGFCEQGGRAIVFTTEMTTNEWFSRMAHGIAGVPKHKNKWETLNRPYTDIQKTSLADAEHTVMGYDIFASNRRISAIGIAAAVRTMNYERRVGLVIVDYLQLLEFPEGMSAEVLKGATGILKNLAQEVGCHVIAVSQLNRASQAEMRSRDSFKVKCVVDPDKSFALPFKEAMTGGAIEADADYIVMLAKHRDCENHQEVCLVKNRHGGDGHSMMIPDFGLSRFRNMSIAEIEHAAHGDMTYYRDMCRDQGHMDE